MKTELAQIGWGSYRSFEGPMYIGNIKVPIASYKASFPQKVLSITAAAEGGHYNAINCYDAGLVSVGAIQFIDAGQFNVCNMVGLVAEQCGIDKVNEVFEPVFKLTNAKFIQSGKGTWRFFHPQTGIVTTAAQQKLLYFGDANGNAKGTFTDKKKTLAKTWAMCMANVWTIPGAIDVQTSFTTDKLMTGFTWGNLKTELFSGDQDETGMVGAMRALILAYAVNSPATVVKHYDIGKNNKHPKLTLEWCYEVLREIVIGGGVDVWKARWSAKKPYVDSMFQVSLPTYNELLNRTWTVPKPIVVEEPVLPSSDVTSNVPVVTEDTATDLLAPETNPTDLVVQKPSGIFGFIMAFVMAMMSLVKKLTGSK